MRANLCLLPLVLLVASGVAIAQSPPAGDALAREATPTGPGNQKAERIVTEDGGSRVEEVRIGGQTQSITVQPKADVPAYEVRPVDGIRAQPRQQANERDGTGGSGGSRVWNFRSF